MRPSICFFCAGVFGVVGCSHQGHEDMRGPEEFKRFAATSQMIDYGRYLGYPTCMLTGTAPHDIKDVTVELTSPSLDRVLGTFGPGIAVEPLQLMEVYAWIFFYDEDERVDWIYIYITPKDKVLISINEGWFALECPPEQIRTAIQSLVAMKDVKESE